MKSKLVAFSAALVLGAFSFIALPGSASVSQGKTLNCTTSTGYSAHIESHARGLVSHSFRTYSRVYTEDTSLKIRSSNTQTGGQGWALVMAKTSGGNLEYIASATFTCGV